jgi:hypothetical protein
MFNEYIGMKVIYRSGSSKEYEAIITAIPDRPDCCSKYPIVSLIFKDIRGKWKKKERVLPSDASTLQQQVWKYTEGKHAWKDGLFVFEDE